MCIPQVLQTSEEILFFAVQRNFSRPGAIFEWYHSYNTRQTPNAHPLMNTNHAIHPRPFIQPQPLYPPWRLKSGEWVKNRQRSHLHAGVVPLLENAFSQISSHGRDFLIETIDYGRIVGETTCVRTGDCDEIVFAQRPNRAGLTRFVTNRQPVPTSMVTAVLKRGDFRSYILITSWFGNQAEPEPWDKNATERSVHFWSQHALVWDSEEVLSGTLNRHADDNGQSPTLLE